MVSSSRSSSSSSCSCSPRSSSLLLYLSCADLIWKAVRLRSHPHLVDSRPPRNVSLNEAIPRALEPRHAFALTVRRPTAALSRGEFRCIACDLQPRRGLLFRVHQPNYGWKATLLDCIRPRSMLLPARLCIHPPCRVHPIFARGPVFLR